MEQLLPMSIGVGLVVSLLFTEFFGLAAGGMVVPGYLALCMTSPWRVFWTLLIGFVTFGIVRAFSTVMILYGRRRTALTILIGYVLGLLYRMITEYMGYGGADHDVIGYIIPGLIAIWIARQGVIETFSSILTVSVMVRLALIVIAGEAVVP